VLEQLEQQALRPATPAWAVSRIAIQRAWLHLAGADPTAPVPAEVLAWVRQCGLGPDDSPSAEHERAHLLLARVLLLMPDQRAAGLRLVARLLAAAETAGRVQLAIALLALRSVGLALAGERDEALTVLARALALGEPEGFIRSFVDLGPPMAALLTRLRATGRRTAGPAPSVAPAYLDRLLAALPRTEVRGLRTEGGSSDSILVEALSAREIEVLRLVAEGQANKEIARQLIMAEATVKAHLTHIFGKLGVTRRTEAVAIARALGVLP
jgi:LuxR family maltose regulon positive regulatory protein